MRYTRREVGKLALMGLPGAVWLARSPLLAAQAARPNSRWAGVDIGMKSGALLVPEDRVDAALKVLKDLEERR